MPARVRRSLRELKARTIVNVANRSFKPNPTIIDRAAFKMVELLLGPAEELDTDFDHSTPPGA